MSATTTMKLISMPTQMATHMRAQLRTQTSSIAFAASKIAAATNRHHHCHLPPPPQLPSGRPALWPLASGPQANRCPCRRSSPLLFAAAAIRRRRTSCHDLAVCARSCDDQCTALRGTLKCCAVRAIVMLPVVIGNGLEPAANTLLLHVSLVLQ